MAKKAKKLALTPSGPPGKRELIVVARPDAGIRASEQGVSSARGVDVSGLSQFLSSRNLHLEPLFGEPEEVLRSRALEQNPDLNPEEFFMDLFYQVQAPEEELEGLAAAFLQLEEIDGAYVKPAGELPTAPVAEEELAILESPPAVPQDFSSRQGYLNAAPEGIDARYAWTLGGGRGADVRIVDCEWGWRFGHMDLNTNQGGVLSGGNSTELRSENHGTAVLGEYSGDRNAYGITGIASDAWAAASSFIGQSSAQAIRNALNSLRPGDILLLEIHRAGPRFSFAGREDQLGYIAIEWWPDDYLAIREAVNRGIIVVEAAGNGAENLDDAIYDIRPSGFPSWWVNPFRRSTLDSGAVIVGAGAPPPGTHGRNWGPDRSRLDFSNYGACLDAQGWGREVTTTGYGDLWTDPDDPDNRDRWYTDRFSGTSSASPIVVGALACVQGVLRASGRIPLSPARARDLLHTTGSPQQDAPGRPRTQRIGNRPNLRQLIPKALETNTWTGVQFTGSLSPNQTRCWFTFNWPAHWHVLWTVMPTSPRPGGPQIKWKVQVERASDKYITYWICVTNLTPAPLTFEGRYAVLGW